MTSSLIECLAYGTVAMSMVGSAIALVAQLLEPRARGPEPARTRFSAPARASVHRGADIAALVEHQRAELRARRSRMDSVFLNEADAEVTLRKAA